MLDWLPQAQLCGRCERDDGCMLGVVVQQLPGGRWGATALETSSAAKGLEGVFEDHAHKVLGRYDSIPEAIEAAESFARSWMKGHKATVVPACDCSEV